MFLLQTTSSRYDQWARLNRGGFNNVNTVRSNGLGDVVTDTLHNVGNAVIAPAQAKLDDLDLAIKVLLVMGGVSSLASLALLLRRA